MADVADPDPDHHLRHRSIHAEQEANTPPNALPLPLPGAVADGAPAHDDAHHAPQHADAPNAASASTPKDNHASAASAAAADLDTCRICRAEGTRDEPLFFPCKCSGSIKYVHQNCLLEWLSHSQKKHCELCKTSFRFTKLYAPNMPQRIPVHVFLNHGLKYVAQNVLVWCRALMVMFVWLAWMPYSMRVVWSSLFWISDFGFGGSLIGFILPPFSPDEVPGSSPTDPAASASPAAQALALLLDSPAPGPTCPAPHVPGGISFEPDPNTLHVYGLNLSGSDPTFMVYLRMLFAAVGLVDLNETSSNPRPSSSPLVLGPTGPRHDTLLSDVAFLQGLTRVQWVNKLVISIVEGQIITILVVICFILVILLRDYVVQQQPEINMRAAWAAADAADAQPQPQPQPVVQQQEQEAPELPELVDPGVVGEAQPDPADFIPPQPLHLGEFLGGTDEANEGDESDGSNKSDEAQYHESEPGVFDFEPGPPQIGSEQVEPNNVQEYLRIYREAGGDPDRIVQIIHAEGRSEQMHYWLQRTQATTDRPLQHEAGQDQQTPPTRGSATAATGDDNGVEVEAGPSTTAASGKQASTTQEDGSGNSTSGEQAYQPTWTWPTATDETETASVGNKGKAREDAGSSEDWDAHTPTSGPASSPGPPPTVPSMQPADESSDRVATAPAETGPVEGTDAWVRHLERELAAPREATRENDDHVEQREAAQEEEFAQVDETDGLDEAPGAPREIHIQLPEQNEEPATQGRPPVDPLNRIVDWLWGPPVGAVGAVGAVAQDANAEEGQVAAAPPPLAPLHDLAHLDGVLDQFDDEEDVLDDDEVAALDQEAAIEDAEDFEGLMELFGMRGPVFGLFQNSLFCALLVTVSIFFAIFLPYNIGRVSLWVAANPTHVVESLFALAKWIEDALLAVFGTPILLATFMLRTVLKPFNLFADTLDSWNMKLWDVIKSSAGRAFYNFAIEMSIFASAEVTSFSALSHQSLCRVKDSLRLLCTGLAAPLVVAFSDNATAQAEATQLLTKGTAVLAEAAISLPSMVLSSSAWLPSLNSTSSEEVVQFEPVYWSGSDRFLAIMVGYLALVTVSGIYLSRRSPPRPDENGQAQQWGDPLADVLNQALGVLKVILIISIEMLVFPLYCGVLLDIALMPLFESTTLFSRLQFTWNNPMTSIFVHWFVGTGYMFHFALFVSMCRKIMRRGVLYFIRDPDDRDFHPIRDVLERSVTTQLRKILFSAFVYGALVMVCLGGVVWGLWGVLPSVLPIHYSSNEPVLEFPIDLLFYNFLMPMGVRFFKPSNGLKAMYTWWFRRCAGMLRITWFLFGERRIDEEGTLVLSSGSPYLKAPLWRRTFLETTVSGEVAPMSWKNIVMGGAIHKLSSASEPSLFESQARKNMLVSTKQLIPDGRFVRSPASDQVKIPKGLRVFLDVTEDNKRLDNLSDTAGTDIYSNGTVYQLVYIPPNFRVRLFLFILFIWMFAAITGVGITIIPLVFGRQIFQAMIPADVRTNDIYAFSMGAYILGTAAYCLYHVRTLFDRVATWIRSVVNLNQESVRRTASFVTSVSRVVYFYFIILVAFPLLVSFFMELYLIIPLHTQMYNSVVVKGGGFNGTVIGQFARAIPGMTPFVTERHTIRLVQSWTLGLVYLKLLTRLLASAYDGTRFTANLQQILPGSMLEPNCWVLTRAFVLPGAVLGVLGLAGPQVWASWLIRWVGEGNISADERVVLYRLAYPSALLMVMWLVMAHRAIGKMVMWRTRIRDEAYLVGERLHNFSVSRGGRGMGAHGRVRGVAAAAPPA